MILRDVLESHKNDYEHMSNQNQSPPTRRAMESPARNQWRLCL